jgi:hypothetical protein
MVNANATVGGEVTLSPVIEMFPRATYGVVDLKLSVHVPPLGAIEEQSLTSCVTSVQSPGSDAETSEAGYAPVLVTMSVLGVPMIEYTGMVPVDELTDKVVVPAEKLTEQLLVTAPVV